MIAHVFQVALFLVAGMFAAGSYQLVRERDRARRQSSTESSTPGVAE